MTINKTTTDLSTLKINYLTQEMYEDALENEEINENELYITPGGGSSDDLLIVQFIYDENLGEYIADKTTQEIVEANLSGKFVVGVYSYADDDGSEVLYLDDTNVEDDGGTNYYSCLFVSPMSYTVNASGQSFFLQNRLYYDDDTITFVQPTSNFKDHTYTPTALKTADYDSSAKMNSTDMTSQEVSSFVGNLSYESEVATVISDMVDYVVAQGTDNGWNYKKYKNGSYDAWQTITSNVAVSTANGSLYQSEQQTITLPSFALVAAANYAINASINGVETIWFEGFSGSSLDITYRIIKATSRASAGRSITFTLMGRWK